MGIPDETLDALTDWESSDRFSERERVALAYSDAVTLSDHDVDDNLFARASAEFDDEQLVALTATIAWENASSKFNRAFRVPEQGLWKRETP